MKNALKLGFLALATATSLTACDFFSSKPKNSPTDTLKVDSNRIDTTKIDTTAIDSNKTKADSATVKR